MIVRIIQKKGFLLDRNSLILYNRIMPPKRARYKILTRNTGPP